jgi:predicted Abi (CAAX) family protease
MIRGAWKRVRTAITTLPTRNGWLLCLAIALAATLAIVAVAMPTGVARLTASTANP